MNEELGSSNTAVVIKKDRVEKRGAPKKVLDGSMLQEGFIENRVHLVTGRRISLSSKESRQVTITPVGCLMAISALLKKWNVHMAVAAEILGSGMSDFTAFGLGGIGARTVNATIPKDVELFQFFDLRFRQKRVVVEKFVETGNLEPGNLSVDMAGTF